MMNLAFLIKISLSYPLSYLLKINNLCFNTSDVLILMYHRVVNLPNSSVVLQDGMYVNSSTFNNQISYIKNNFNVVSLEKCFHILKNNSYNYSNKPVCCITFDDGWKDFYDNAFEIIKKYNVCATVFLPTDYIGTNNQMWTDKLSIVILNIYNNEVPYHNIKESSSSAVRYVETLKGTVKERHELAINYLKELPLKYIDNIILELSDRWRVDCNIQDRSFLSWEEIVEMYNSGFVHFGSHTKSHKIMTTIPDDIIMEELIFSREKLIEMKIVSKLFIPFAYPNGNHTDKIAKMVERSGYSLALTTKKGWNCVIKNTEDIFKLKRVAIHEDMTSTTSMLACRIHGIF